MLRGISGLFFVPKNYWITIWKTTYCEDGHEALQDKQHILDHEWVHIPQWEKYKILYPILYLLLPVPFVLAYFRYKFEREAYLIDIKSKRLTTSEVVDLLWRGYCFSWPRPLMAKWFKKQGV